MDQALKNSERVSSASAVSRNAAVAGENYIPVVDKSLATRADVEKAIALIEQSFAIQEQRIQIIVDAAVLAVEQVQDKRLEMQEKGKTVTINDVIFDLLSVYLWEVGFIGHVVQPLVKEVTRIICERSLKYSLVYNQLAKSDYGAEMIGYIRNDMKPKDSKALLKEIIEEHVRKKSQYGSEEFAMFSKETRTLVASFEDVVWKKGSGAVGKWKDIQKKVKQTTLGTTDTPGVSMLKSAQSYVGSQRFALQVQKARIIALIRSQPSMTVQELRDMMSIFVVEELPDTEFIRDQYQWTFEIIIWARMYGFTSEFATSPGIVGFGGKGFDGIKWDVTNYWFTRFRDVMVPYAQKKGENWDQLSVEGKTLRLKYYYMEVMKQLEEISKNTVPINEAFVVTNEQ
ncbi:hypothetical protein [Cohnella sp. GCM10027633]|uniref:hypothetical protein n=1 Tax=unclassified Cohnella TaxID=2636738 RepID=UPI00363734AA